MKPRISASDAIARSLVSTCRPRSVVDLRQRRARTRRSRSLDVVHMVGHEEHVVDGEPGAVAPAAGCGVAC